MGEVDELVEYPDLLLQPFSWNSKHSRTVIAPSWPILFSTLPVPNGRFNPTHPSDSSECRFGPSSKPPSLDAGRYR